MKRLSILLIPLLILALLGVLIGCDKAEEIKNDIQDKIEGKDTPTPTTSDGTIPMTSDFWIKVNTGQWEETPEGIKVYGAGYRFPHQGLQSKANYNFSDSETFIKWKAHGGANGDYSAFWPLLLSDYDPETMESSGGARGGYFTTDHSWKNSTVISQDIWYYTRIKVNADNSYTTITATGDYDSNGGTQIYAGEGAYQNAQNGKIVVIFNDNYGGTETYLIVGEAKTSAGKGISTATPTDTATPTPTIASDEKSVLVWVCDSITNAIFDGQPVTAGQESQVTIELNQPLQAEFDFTANQHGMHAIIDLDNYYDFFVLKSNGGWGQTKYQSGYDSDKSDCPAVTPIATPTPTPTTTEPAGELELGRFPSAMASDGTNVWVTTQGNSSLNKLRGTDGMLLASYNVGQGPSDILFDGTNLWVANQYDDTVMKVSPSNGAILGTYPVGDYPAALEFDGENIWVANQKGSSITKLRASDGANLLTYPMPGGTKIPRNLEFDGEYLWVGCYWGYLMRLDVSSDTLQPSYSTGGHITGLAYDGESVRAVIWHEGGDVPEVRKYSTAIWNWEGDYQLNNIDLPSDIAYDGTSFWVTDSNENKVIKLPANYYTYGDMGNYSDPEHETIYDTGDGPADLLYANGYMWVANDRDGTITRIPD